MDVLMLVLAGLLTTTSEARLLANPPPEITNFLDSNVLVSDLLSLATLPVQKDAQHNISFILQDGTQIGGLLFLDKTKGVRPLILADFGILTSRVNGLGADFIEKIVQAGLLDANFLVLDDASGADFYSSNRSISLGGYDAGRMLVELGQTLKTRGISFSSLHLLGESLGGLAVLEALIEDQRRGTEVFQSAVTFSGAVDEAGSTETVMSAFGHSLKGISGPPLSLLGTLFLASGISAFDQIVQQNDPSLATMGLLDSGSFFYTQFGNRLSQAAPENWNPSVSRKSVESYVISSSALMPQMSQIKVPVIVVHAQNDPVVDFAQFQSFAQSQMDNPNVQTLATPVGSHCGFIGAYGAAWVADLVNRSLNK